MNDSGQLLASFTVKYEAQQWAVKESKQPLEHLHLSRMRDGLYCDKTETRIPWER
jgi:hypothetical protein